MNKLLALLPFLLLGACGYGDDTSTLGDLVEHRALSLDVTYRQDNNVLLVDLSNRTVPGGACLGLTNRLVASLNGMSGSLFPGGQSESHLLPGVEHTTCPEAIFAGIDKLDEPLVLTLEDLSRSEGDPARSASVTLHNAKADPVVPVDATPDAEGGLQLKARDRLVYAVPNGERFDRATYEISGSVPDSGEARAEADGFSVPLDKITVGTNAYLAVYAFTKADPQACVGASCTMTIYRQVEGALHVTP